MRKILLTLALLCGSIFFTITGITLTALSSGCSAPNTNTTSSTNINPLKAIEEGGLVLYSRDGCSYCINAKNLLDQKGIKYKVISLDNDPTTVNELVAKTNHRTFPFIFYNKKFIGGYNELKKMIDNNEIK